MKIPLVIDDSFMAYGVPTGDRETMKITDKDFTIEMADSFEDGIMQALEKQSDTFSFPYVGGDGSPAGVAPEMTCLVLLMPAPIAELMQEGMPFMRENLAAVLAAAEAAGGAVKG